MKQTFKKWLLLSVILLVTSITQTTKAQVVDSLPDAENWKCGFDISVMRSLAEDTGFVGKMGRYNHSVANPGAPASGTSYIVPVVFHLIGNPAPTMSYAQVRWQLARINAAFQNQMNIFNGQALGPRAVNTQIEFRLACVAQNSVNLWTNASEPGVMRYATTSSTVLNQSVLAPSTFTPMLAITHPTAYPTTFPFANYLNIWCVPSINGGSVIGYGTFPWLTAGIDGIVMDIDDIGNNSYPTNFPMISQLDKGAVLAHEIGHYLGLYHTFETITGGCTASPVVNPTAACYGTTSVTGACDGDLILDTPPTFITSDLAAVTSINSCKENNYPYGGPNADQPDQLVNYMSYSDDDKLNTFTQGQTNRMVSTFTTSSPGNRSNLVSTSNLTATGVYTNPCANLTSILTGIFNYSIAAGSSCTNVNVQFTNPLSVGFNTVGTTYTWNFGNGTGTGSNPLHAYSTSGGTLYLVTCTATNGTATATYTQNISINFNASIVSQSGFNMPVCRGSEQTIYISFGTGVPSVQLTDGVNPPITVYNAQPLNFSLVTPYTFIANASASYSIMPLGCGSGVATFNVIDCCNSLITNGDFSAGISGYTTQLVTPFVASPYPYFGSYEILDPAAPTSLTAGIYNATGNAMNIDGFSGANPNLSYVINQGCPATTTPSSVTPRPLVWRQMITGLQPSTSYYYSFKMSENFNSGNGSCILNFQTSVYNSSATLLAPQTLAPLRHAGFFNNPNAHLDFVVYTYTFATTSTVTPIMTFSVDINQITNFNGYGWDFVLDNITLNQLTPSIQAIGSNTICPAQTTTLNAVTSCNTSTVNFNYVWTPATGLSNPNIINPVANPTTTTVYTLVATPTTTGTPASITTVTITVRPTFTITPSTQIIYAGNSATLTVTGSTGIYTWNPGAITGNSVVVTPTATTVYTVTNAASGTCTANNTATVIVSTACSQTATATYNDTYFPAGTYTTSGQVLDFSGTITFTNTTSFTGYTIRMAPGAFIKVLSPSVLTLDNCKLFGCTELWQGIRLETMDSRAASIDVRNGTTIEDMYAGIYRLTTYTTTSYAQSGYIKITDSKLNKNYIGVQLLSIPGYTPAGTSYSLTVKNSTLTTISSTTSPGNNLKPSTIPSYTYAYNQIAGGSGGGTAAYTAFPRSHIGINLYNLSTNNVIVGDSAGAANTFNTFSNMDFGIKATNANLRVHNNYFYNLKGSPKQVYIDFSNPVTPIGPDEIGIAVVAEHTVANTYSLQVGTKNSQSVVASLSYPKSNTFKTLNKAIQSKNCSVVIVKGDLFDADTTDLPIYDYMLPGGASNTYEYYKAQSGIWISGLGTGANLSYNFMKNYRAAIYSSHTMSVTSGAYVTVASNNIQSAAAVGYCRQAISLEQVGGANIGTDLLDVKLNSLNKVYNGIYAKAVLGGLNIHDNSNITLDNVKTYGQPPFTAANHLGIYLLSVQNGKVFKNLNITSNTAVAYTASSYSLTNGVYVVTSPSNTITCNSVNNSGRGFYFQGNCASNNGWLGNAISNSYRGLELKSSGVMGIQGAITGATLAANTWSNVTQETFVSGTTNANTASIMFVAANATYTTAPGINLGTAGQTYTVGATFGIDIRTGTSYSCGTGGGGGELRMASADNTPSVVNESLYSNLASASDKTYPEFSDEFIFQNQQLVYQLQKQGVVSHDANNETLQRFYKDHSRSNVGKFIDVKEAVANNQIALAQSKNNSISPTNEVQQKTKRVNELMLKINANVNYRYSNKELQDLSAMANECAFKGWYVAQSRNILNAACGQLMNFKDCDDNDEQISRTEAMQETVSVIEPKRSFTLFPNPNNGNMTMVYDLGKDNNATMNLYDVTGKLINSYDLQNSNGLVEINETQLHNGIYFYHVVVDGRVVNTNKIVVIK